MAEPFYMDEIDEITKLIEKERIRLGKLIKDESDKTRIEELKAQQGKLIKILEKFLAGLAKSSPFNPSQPS